MSQGTVFAPGFAFAAIVLTHEDEVGMEVFEHGEIAWEARLEEMPYRFVVFCALDETVPREDPPGIGVHHEDGFSGRIAADAVRGFLPDAVYREEVGS